MLDGMIQPKEYAKRSKELGFKYIACTDHGNFDGLIKFQKACKKESKDGNIITPISGIEGYLCKEYTKTSPRGHICLWIKNQKGFENLTKIVTISNIEGFYYKPRINYETLLKYHEGLVIGSACVLSFIKICDDGRKFFKQLVDIKKDDLYLEVMPHNMEMQVKHNRFIKRLSKKTNTKIILSQDTHYLHKKDWKAHEVLLAMQRKAKWTDPKRWKFPIKGFHLRSTEEMVKAATKIDCFDKKYFHNTIEIAEKCKDFRIEKQDIELPHVPGIDPNKEDKILWKLCCDGYRDIYKRSIEQNSVYHDRLKFEFEVIKDKNFVRYLLIVWELCKWCKQHEILIGPRGSCAASLICRCLKITTVDPIQHELIFDRFINIDRTNLPDIDLDFEDNKRYLIKQHLEEVYGFEKIAHISTFGRLKPRAAVQGVARVFEVPSMETNAFTKLIDDKQEDCIDIAINENKEGKQYYSKYPKIIKYAKLLENNISHLCVSGDTFLILPNNKFPGIKLRKLKNLYKDNYRGKVRSYNFDKEIFYFDNIVNIIKTGIDRIYELEIGGYECKLKKVKLTKNHKILTKNGWKKLRHLKIGEYVATNGEIKIKKLSTKFKKGCIPWNKGKKGVQVPWNKGLKKEDHPSIQKASERWINNNPSNKYYNRKKSSIRNRKHGRFSNYYINLLNKFPICQNCNKSKSEHRHHIDKDRNNNKKSNLMALCQKCHQLIIHKNFHPGWIRNDIGIKWCKVKSIKFIGIEEVYDVTMKSKNQNFVGNKFVLHNSKHAAGLIISDKDIAETGRCSLRESDGVKLINWEMDDAEYVGLMKLDALGLKELTVIGETLSLIENNHNIKINLEDISIEDKKILNDISIGNTVGVFQFNTWGITNLVKQMGIEKFSHMSDAVALYRPGPLLAGLTDLYVRRKNGEKWQGKNKIYDEITKDTYNVCCYQEQIIQVINKVAGLPYSTADNIRKIISKKRDKKLFEQYKKQFINGCKKQKTFSRKEAEQFWEDLQGFSSYCFNKGHSVSYALVAYWSAYLKLNYPTEFICCALTYSAKSKKKEIIEEAYRLGLQLKLPKVNMSDPIKWVAKNNNLYVPFKEVKGLGDKKALIASKSPEPEFKVKKLKGSTSRFGKNVDLKHKGALGDLLNSIGAYDKDKVVDITDDIKKLFEFRIVLNPKINYKRLYELFNYDIKPEELDPILNGDIPKRFKKLNFLKKVSFSGHEDLNRCNSCELYEQCKIPVHPSPGKYNLMIDGEAPGNFENQTGRGFHEKAKAGKNVWRYIKKYGFKREQFHISNVAKCYPSKTRTPNKEQIAKCTSLWLEKEIKEIKPIAILAFGNTNRYFFEGINTGITSISGKTIWNEKYNCWICFCLHPASIIYNQDNIPAYEAGIKNFIKLCKRIGLRKVK